MDLRALLLSAALLTVTSCASNAVAPAKCPEPTTPPPVNAAAFPASAAAESVVTAGDFKVTVRASAFGNLAYQLDCLADVIGRCTVAAIRPFWAPTWTKDDGTALAAWKDVRRRYHVDAELAGEAPPSLVPLPFRAVEVDKQMRIASLLAATSDEYRANLRMLLPPQDAEALVSATQHFRPRFEAWWGASGAAAADRFRTGLAGLFEKPELAAIVTRTAAFYATPLAKGTPIDFDLVILPVSTTKWTSGEQLLAHGVIELRGGDTPEGQIGVLCHELFHFFYNARSPAQQAALASRFTSSNDPLAALAYYLLDESVATAVGNGVVDKALYLSEYLKRRKTENGFYGNYAIDATSKGILTRTNEDPTLGAPLDSPDTVVTLIAATRDALGEDPRPIDYLRTFAVEQETEGGAWTEVMNLTEQATSANSIYTAPLASADGVAMVTKHSALSVVYVLSRRHLAALDAYGAAIPKEARTAIARERSSTNDAFAFVFKRGTQARGFVIVSNDAAGAKAVADALFAKETAFLGLFRAAVSTPQSH
jgi:hypothetical protein